MTLVISQGLICLTAYEDQSRLVGMLSSNMNENEAVRRVAYGRESAGRQGIDKALAEHNIDIIIGPGDSGICDIAAQAGYPTAMVPLGMLKGKYGLRQPHGLMITSRKNGEGKMLEFMMLWEEIVGNWQALSLLREEAEEAQSWMIK